MTWEVETKKGPTNRTGLAHVPQAAESLAGDSLRARIRVSRRGDPPVAKKKKGPNKSDLFSLMLAERTGLEPATPGVTGRYSNQLNYRSVFTDLFFAVGIIGRSGGR